MIDAAPPPALHAPAPLKALAWTGTATVHDGTRTLRIGVSTTIDADGTARSRSWLLDQGPAAARTMVVGAADAWIERGGVRQPMPAAMAAHERAQFALYALMQAALAQAAPARTMTLAGPPATVFRFDAAGRLAEARNAVPAADDTARTIAQHIVFSGEAASGALRWPRTIAIAQDGKPFFRLDLDGFSAR